MSDLSNNDLEYWKSWNTSLDEQEKKKHLRSLINNLEPIIVSESSKWHQSGLSPVLLKNHAQNLAIKAVETFDPLKGTQLSTHVVTHLQHLSRFVSSRQNIIRQPEEQVYQYRKLLKEQQEGDMMSPVDSEFNKNFTAGIPLKDFKPTVEHFYSKASEAGGVPVMQGLTLDNVAVNLFYKNLDEKNRVIFDKLLTKSENKARGKKLAQELGISSAAISKRKTKLQNDLKKYMDSLQNISGF